MSEKTQPKIKIGILGGGQLAMMLAQNNPFFDAQIFVYTEDRNCPAALTDATLIEGRLEDTESLKDFLKNVNFLTFENEFIDTFILNDIRNEFPQLFILPDLKTIQVLQNKLFQKFEFQKLNLPTSKFLAFNPELDSLDTWLEQSYEKLQNKTPSKVATKIVIKWAFGGYDGKGNFVVKSKEDLHEAKHFCERALIKGSTVYAEEFISFQKELAQVYVRSLKGDFVSFPLVVSEQENNICKTVYGPATEFGVSKEVEAEALAFGKTIADKLKYVGSFAIEYFLTEDNKILINEMAPRVHNSAHYTIDASRDNQFSHHLRAILGATLTTPATYAFFAMRNLIGPTDIAEKTCSDSVAESFPKSEDIKIYWYGKKQLKPNRKMGHINTIALTKEDLLRKIELMKLADEKIWSLI